MDSLERLAHSLEQAVALIHSLRRENRELSLEAARARSEAARLPAAEAELGEARGGLEQARRELEEARRELDALKQEPAEDLVSAERARQAELEAARLAEEGEAVRRRLEGQVQELELLLAQARASADETMPLPDRSQELEGLARRCAELEVMLSERHAEGERLKGALTALQVKLAESASPEELAALQAQLAQLKEGQAELEQLRAAKAQLEADRMDVRRQKKALAAIRREREAVRMKLEEVYATLDLMRLA